MRCALNFNKNKSFADQKLSAWGEMQPLTEEPCYREDKIKDIADRNYFYGYKCGLADALNNLEYNIDAYMDIDEKNTLGKIKKEVVEEALEALQDLSAAELAMQLFRILDSQEE